MTLPPVRTLALGLLVLLLPTTAFSQSLSWPANSSPTHSHATSPQPAAWHSQEATDAIGQAAQEAVEAVMSCVDLPRIALTFDDGPFPGSTDAILTTLRQRGVPATFFVVGQRARHSPGLVRAIVEDGHEVAAHSHTHADLSRLDTEGQAREARQARDAIQQAVPHVHLAWWRAPYGALQGVDMSYPASLGMRHMGWSIDTLDWQAPDGATWMNRVLSQARDGSVVLMHDHAAVSRRHLGELIDELWARGFVFRTLSGLSEPACYAPDGAESLHAHHNANAQMKRAAP